MFEDFDFNEEDFNDCFSNIEFRNGVPYKKRKQLLKENQEFFVTHLEIREKKGDLISENEESNLLDCIARDGEYLPRHKVEKRVAYTNKNFQRNWFIVECGIVVNLID
jgi:hypothetical protein